MEESPENLLIDIEGGICTITLNRPKNLNVFNEKTLDEFYNVLEDVSKNAAVKVVVLLSACEKAFTAGADIKEMVDKDSDGGRKFAQRGHRIARKLETMPQPVIIGVHGYVLGGGVEFSCACDIRIAAEGSIFSQPEIDIGVIPGWGGTQRLSRIVGIAKAKEMIYTGKRVDANEAKDIGLVNHVVPKEKLQEAVMTMAKTIASKGKLALFDAKKSINQLYESFIEEGLKYEIDRWSELFETHDQKEGMKAFLEGRSPEYKDE
ncbi:MAG: enoyl-CoA hydratase/isomerase family protein [Thermoplasmata archaeon]|nr:MAG: enoyl-CoA hydratase/isomerase family protein [Thermoplasmata archaeon]